MNYNNTTNMSFMSDIENNSDTDNSSDIEDIINGEFAINNMDVNSSNINMDDELDDEETKKYQQTLDNLHISFVNQIQEMNKHQQNDQQFEQNDQQFEQNDQQFEQNDKLDDKEEDYYAYDDDSNYDNFEDDYD